MFILMIRDSSDILEDVLFFDSTVRYRNGNQKCWHNNSRWIQVWLMQKWILIGMIHLIRPRWRAEKKNSWSSQNRDEKWSKNEEKTTASKPVKDRCGERTEGQNKDQEFFRGERLAKNKREREKTYTEFIRLQLDVIHNKKELFRTEASQSGVANSTKLQL